MKKQQIIRCVSALLLFVAVAIIVVQYRRNLGQSTQESQLVIGVILPETGPAAHIGKWQRAGIEMLENDPSIRFIFEDSGGDPKKSLDAYRKLVDIDHVGAIISSLSSATNPIIPNADSDKIPLVMISVSYPGAAERSPYAFRFHPGSESETHELAKYFQSLAPGAKLGVIAINDEFGDGAVHALESEELGATSTLAAEYYAPNLADPKPIVDRVLSARPSCIYVVGYVNATATIIRQIRESGYEGALACNMAMSAPSYLETVGKGFENTVFCTSTFSLGQIPPSGRRFFDGYVKRYGSEPNSFSAMSYDGASFLTHAFKSNRAQSRTLIQSLDATKIFDGAMGHLNIDRAGNVEFPLTLAVMQGGRLVERK